MQSDSKTCFAYNSVTLSVGCTEPGNQFKKGQEVLDQEGGQGRLWNRHHGEWHSMGLNFLGCSC